MTTWKFRIANTGSLIDQLARSSGSQQDFSIWKEEPDDGGISYWLSSPWLDRVTDLQELSNRLSALKCLVDGAIFLYTPPPICFDAIWDQSAGKTENAPAVMDHLRLEDAVDVDTDQRIRLPEPSLAEGLLVFQDGPLPQRARGATSLMADDVGAAMFLARHDAVVRGCLLCLGYSGVNYVSLYQCLDFMNGEQADKEAALAACQVKKAEMDRFGYTANNFCASGPLGRHGGLGKISPRHTPMTETDAQKVLLPVVRAFVKERAKAANLDQHWQELPP